MGVSIFLNSDITAFVDLPLDIARVSLYKLTACSMGIRPAMAWSASSDTDLYAFVKNMRKGLCICCN